MKKVLCLALGMLLCLLACAALADTEYSEGHFSFSVNEEAGEVTILRLLENYAVVKVPDTLHGCPVTKVGEHAFSGSARLQRVILPDTVTDVGSYAFTDCNELTDVQMKGVTTIGVSAFENTKLCNVVLPKGVTQVGKRAFANCLHLYSFTAPASLAEIPEEMFAGSRFLKTVVLPEGVTTIGSKAFSGVTTLKEIKLPATLTTVGVNPFVGCTGLTSIKVAADNTALKEENGALIRLEDACLVSYAAGLKAGSYTVPADVKVVGVAAFSQSLNLKSVVVPESVEKLSDYAFWYCTSLKTIVVPEGVAVHSTAFSECYALVDAALPAGVVIEPELPVNPML